MKALARLALGCIALAGMTVGTSVASASTIHHNTGTYYLALGDSVGLGYQTPDIPTDRACTDSTNDATGNRGFVCLFGKQLQSVYPGIQTANLALAVSPGEDSCSFTAITNCEGAKTRVNASSNDTAPYKFNQVAQLTAAEAFLKTHNVAVISLTLGGNDFLPLLHLAETQGPAVAEKQLPTVEKRLSTNLETIVGTLRQVAPSAKLVITDQYNPLSGLPASALGPNGAAILTLAKGALKTFHVGVQQLAAATGSIDADVYDPFQNKGPELTWITDNQNIHPNGQGYKLMAQAVWAGFEDATAKLFVKISQSPSVKPGAVQTIKISTLPYSTVKTVLSYSSGGWYTTAVKKGTADIQGNLTFKWHAPIQKTTVSNHSCSTQATQQKCAKSNFIIA